MDARKLGQEPAKNKHTIITAADFSNMGSPLRSSLCMLVVSSIFILFQPITTLSAEIYLFMNPDNNAESSEAGNTVVNLLGSMLKEELQGWTIKHVSKDQVTLPPVERYADEYHIANYLKVKVSSTPGGLYLDIDLVANTEKFNTFVNIGAEKRKDSATIRLRLRKIPLFYRALIRGLSPNNIIYVKCFKPLSEISRPLLPRELTLQLPSMLEETSMNKQYHTTGIGHLDFDRFCEGMHGGLNEEDLLYIQVFRHFIEGYITKANSELVIPVHVHSGNRMHIINLPSLQVDSAIDNLANHIANCWGKWDDANCK